MSDLFRPGDRQQSPGRRLLDLSTTNSATTATTGSRVRSVSLKARHSGLFEAVHRLDAQIDEASRRQLAGWISEQYATEYGDIPLGFLSRCYLGAPYVDHRLDLLQSIVEHFTPGDSVPAPYSGARALARPESVEFVEVYASGALVPIRVDGSVDASAGGTHG